MVYSVDIKATPICRILSQICTMAVSQALMSVLKGRRARTLQTTGSEWNAAESEF